MPLPFWTRRFGKSQIQICADAAEQNHWSECGRATSVANGEALARPHRSVPALGLMRARRFTFIVLALCGTCLLGCVTDISHDTRYRPDYVIDGTYRVKKALFLD